MEIEVLRDRDALRRLEPEWRELCAAVGASALAVRPDWVLPWTGTFGRRRSLRFLALREAGLLTGLLPLLEEGRGLALLRDDHSPEPDVLALPGRLRDVLEAARARLFRRDEPFRSWRAAGISLASPTYAALSGLLVESRAFAYEARAPESSRTEVSADLETFVASRTKNFRKQVARARREAADGGLRIDLVRDEAGFDAVLPSLERISRASWQGASGTGTFSEPVAAAFYSGVARRFARAGDLRLFVCRRGDEAVGFALDVVTGRRMDALKHEFDPAHERSMVGWQLMMASYEHARATGIAAVDMGSWPTEFTRRWRTATTPHADLVLFRPGLAGAARFLFPFLAKELGKRLLGRPSGARCLPVLDFSP